MTSAVEPGLSEHLPWTRESFSAGARFHAFAHYRDLPSFDRSLIRAYNEHRARCLQKPAARLTSGRWKTWSVEDDWLTRSSLYDGHLERVRQRALEAEQVAASQRHARSLQAAISSLMIPVRVALETAASGAGLDALKAAARADASGLRAVVADARAAAAHLSQLVAAERLVLGLTTSRDEIRDVPMHDTIAAAIVASPEATHAAVQLLDTISRVMPTPVESS